MYRNITTLFLILFLNTIFAQTKDSIVLFDSLDIYTKKALYNKDLKLYDKATIDINKSINYSKKTNNNTGLANSYITLGTIKLELMQYDIAIEQFIRAITILNAKKPDHVLATCNYKIALCYMYKGNFNKAETYFLKAISIYESLGLNNAIPVIKLQKAMIYEEKNRIDIAEKLLNEILLLPFNEDTESVKADALYLLGKIQSNQKNYETAIEYLLQAFKINVSIKNVEGQSKTAKKISEVYEYMLLKNEALQYLKIYTTLKDSQVAISKSKNQSLINDKSKLDDVVKYMGKLDQKRIEQDKESKFSKLINILSIALITILSLLSLSLYKNNIIRNKSNDLLREKNKELEIAKERTEKASKARSEFLSTVSHELRTPLNAINGISHILLDDEPKESQIEYLKSLKFSGNYLLTYINEILEINRIESDNIEVEKINFDYRELLQNIQNALKELASRNNNNFTLNIASNVPEILVGDPTKLSQIFINLINNALKFTKNGSVIINTSVVNNNNIDCRIRFEVKDTGIGIPEEKLESIFDSFSQGSVEINRKYGGTGLGLAIVKRLISLMGGEIKLESIVGVGSSFSFELDFKIGQKQDTINENKISDEKIFINKKILLVEDNKINQMITKKILEKKEMLCEICETGEESIEKMKTNSYHLVLMDVHLPGINGTEATQEIRKFDNKTPIIALTAISLNENREMLLSFGMNDVITKPFNPDVFYKIIEQNL
jgi:signal transduction histidine kinase